MIVVRVELHSARTGRVTELARATITNDGSGTVDTGTYGVRTLRGRSTKELDRFVTQREGVVKEWPRRRLHVWNLVAEALRCMGYRHGPG